MCRYCNMIPDIHDWNETEFTYSAEEDICDGKYEGCKIVYYKNKYYIRLTGSYETDSEPISWCPFCGRRLYVED